MVAVIAKGHAHFPYVINVFMGRDVGFFLHIHAAVNLNDLT